ncbi:MAG: GNAT family N-acetyltransferase [Caldilineaceae bacterium]
MLSLLIREVEQVDTPFLWEMLYHAAHMAEDGATHWETAKEVPFLTQYVQDWGQPGDFGLIAVDTKSRQKVGAAWLRLLIEDKTSVTYQDDETPELAIAIVPDWIGCGVGTALMTRLVESARQRYPALVLSVRADNPAIRLYQRFGFVETEQIVNRVGTISYKMLLKFE